MVARAEHMGISVEAPFENEFYLASKRDGTYIPFDQAPVYSSIGLDLSAQIMHDIVKALGEQDLIVEQAINEYGPGQQEISVRHAPGVRAADNQIKLRATVRGVPSNPGPLANFPPTPLPEEIGSGCPIHLSLCDPEGRRNLLF